MRKKVLYVITKSNFGGAQKYVYDLATSLPKEHFDVIVALGGKGVLLEKLRTAGIRTISLPALMRDVNPFKDFLSFFSLWKLFRTERPDIIHVNSAKAGGLGALAARCAGVPTIVFTAHGWAFKEDRSALARFFVKLFSWFTVVLAHKTIAVGNAVRNDTNKWPLVRHKITTIRNGLSAPTFKARDEARTHLTNLANIEPYRDAFIIGTIAELHQNKGLTYAIHAFAQIAPSNPHVFYFIIGDGEEKEKLQILIKQHDLERQVYLLGFLPDAAQYLSAFDCFLLPSVKEGLPYVILESGLASLPVITTAIGGIPEIIDDTKTGLLVPSRDVDALARAIKWMIENPERRTDLGTALYKKVSHDFSLTKMSTETIALYSGR